jgi:GNAT superfamily N-acetyltransferase
VGADERRSAPRRTVPPARAREAELHFGVATADEADEIARLRTAAAEALTAVHGPGHWSIPATAKGVLFGMRHARVLTARSGGRLAGVLRLATKKPWAIDVRYFTVVPRPLYLTDMAVHPDVQRRGVGRRLLARAEEVAREWPAQAIRLDAYDAAAGAGPFYATCGYREVGRVTYRGNPLVYYERVFSSLRAPGSDSLL